MYIMLKNALLKYERQSGEKENKYGPTYLKKGTKEDNKKRETSVLGCWKVYTSFLFSIFRRASSTRFLTIFHDFRVSHTVSTKFDGPEADSFVFSLFLGLFRDCCKGLTICVYSSCVYIHLTIHRFIICRNRW